MFFSKRWVGFIFTFLPLLGWVSLRPAFAQSVTAAADGTGTIVTSDGNRFDITGGSLSGDGANLFHSFEQLGLDQNQAASFLTDPNVQNVLSRVVGGDASVINGLLEVAGSNANLYLLNPAGIIFGTDATLNVPADFMATTADGISFGDEWFSALENNDYAALVGNPTELLFSNSEPGSILNAGDLTVSEGQTLSLVGGTVVNTGSLTAPGGGVTIAAVPGTGRVNLSHENLLLTLEFKPPGTAGPTPLASTLTLSDLLTGGEVSAITGVTVDEQGRLFLTSSSQPVLAETGTAVVSGDIDVAAETGGTVQVLGDQVSLVGANIDATGSQGGGEVLIGGNYRGEGSTPTATNTWVDGETVIAADATVQGDGGRVIVWADDAATFAGTITARGGTEGGNGGFVETSGKQTLDFTGATVDAGATDGLAGHWFLDPGDIIIDAAQAIAVQTALASGTNFELTTVGGTGGNGDITLQSDIDATATNDATLTLTASRYITDGGTDSTIDITDGNLVMNLNQEGLAAEQNPTISDAIDVVGNITNGTTTLNLGAGTYREGAQIDVTQDMTINGAGTSQTIISGDSDADGNGNHRVFYTNGVVTLSNMTIQDGVSGVSSGGGIYAYSGSLTINDTIISGNNSGEYGGGVFTYYAAVSVNNSTISNNVADQDGGALYSNYSNRENITINNSTISGNSTINDEGGAIWSGYANVEINNSTISGNSSATDGGAIWSYGGTLTINNSTISGNTADDEGGGLYIGNSTSTITNSTISNNVATNGSGGGIRGVYSQIEIVNSTISGNTATNANGGGIDGSNGWSGAATIQLTNSTVIDNTAVTGGGVHEGIITSNNSIIAGNTATTANPDVSGTFISNGTNLIGDLTGSTGFNANEELTVSLEQVLDTTLADNGGPTQTHALVAGSPAIDAGSNDIAPTTDQRLLSRSDTADIGAFEYGALPDLTIVSGDDQTTDVNTDFGSPLQVLVTDANGDPYSNTSVTFTLPTTGASGSFEDATSYTVITDADGLATTPIITANETSGSFIATVTIDEIGTLVLDGVEVAQFTLTSSAVVPVAPTTPTTPTTNTTLSILDGPPEAQPVEPPVANACVPNISLDTSEVINSEIPSTEVDTDDDKILETDADSPSDIGSSDAIDDTVTPCR